MVFIIIGILIGSTLLQIDIPFLKKQETVLEALPPANGVFLLEEEGYTEMIMNQAVPEDLAGIPLTADKAPSIVVYSPLVNINKLSLHNEKDENVPYTSTPAEKDSYLTLFNRSYARQILFLYSSIKQEKISIGAWSSMRISKYYKNIYL